MRLFRWSRPRQEARRLLAELVTQQAARLQAQGKSRQEAEYLALCSVIDDLNKQPDGARAYRTMLQMLEQEYRDQLDEVITYIAWSRGRLALNPQREEALKQRHG
jgi:hypothetical protein